MSDVLLKRGMCYIELGDVGMAQQDLSQGIDLQQKEYLGQLFYQRSRTWHAQQNFQMAVEVGAQRLMTFDRRTTHRLSYKNPRLWKHIELERKPSAEWEEMMKLKWTSVLSELSGSICRPIKEGIPE